MLARFAEFGIEVCADDARIDKLIRHVKEREFEGWSFDSAEASFELMARARWARCLIISLLVVFG